MSNFFLYIKQCEDQVGKELEAIIFNWTQRYRDLILCIYRLTG